MITKEEASDLQSHIENKTRCELEFSNAKAALSQAIAKLESFTQKLATPKRKAKVVRTS